jgi:hypothetical protein
MRNSFLAAITLGATVLSASAFAQVEHGGTDAYPYSLSLKGSFVLPLQDNLRDVDKWFAGASVEYLFPTQLIRGSETFMELGAYIHTTASNNVNIFPLTINQRFWGKPNSNGNRSYAFVGAGVTWIEPKGSAKITGHVGFGMHIGPKTFVELGLYHAEQDSKGLRNSTALFSIGYRF